MSQSSRDTSQDMTFCLQEFTLFGEQTKETRTRCNVCKVLGCDECKERKQPGDATNKNLSAEECKKRRKEELKKILNDIKKHLETVCMHCDVCKTKQNQSNNTEDQVKKLSSLIEDQSKKDTKKQSENTYTSEGKNNKPIKNKMEVARIKGILGEHPLQIRILTTRHSPYLPSPRSSRSSSLKSSASTSRSSSISPSSCVSRNCFSHFDESSDSEEERAVFTEDTPDDDTSYEDSFDKRTSSDSMSDENILEEESFDCTDYSSE